jgi:hypothetical protein
MDRLTITNDDMLETITRGGAGGVIAGTAFGIAEMAGSALAGWSIFHPVRMAASVWHGAAAFTLPLSLVLGLGVMIHFAISISWGMLAAAAYEWTEWPRKVRLDELPMAILGVSFGAFVWLVDFAVVGANFVPWTWRLNQPAQFLMHAIFFGVPLGLALAVLAKKAANPPDVARPMGV